MARGGCSRWRSVGDEGRQGGRAGTGIIDVPFSGLGTRCGESFRGNVATARARNPPFLVFKRPARPYKSPIQNGFT
jgi:hypothetical protein